MIERDIPGFPGYRARCDGAVISYKYKHPHPLKPSITNSGYYHLTLRVGGKYITAYTHKLIATAFYGEPEEGMEVNHRDANKLNNAAYNLEFVTSKGNKQHAIRAGLMNFSGIMQPTKVKCTDTWTDESRTFFSLNECAEYLGCIHTSITYPLHNKSLYKGRYRIEYTED